MANFDSSFVSDKEYIRGVIRKHSSHNNFDEGAPSRQHFNKADNVQAEFWKNFQENGGKIIRCFNRQDRLKYLQMLAKDQQYNYILNTHVNLCNDLDQLQLNYVNNIPMNTRLDAVVAISTTLVARNGSIGFAQPLARFFSMRNLARDVIVISRLRDIVPDIEDALARSKRSAGDAGLEFITPTPVVCTPENDRRTTTSPRYILLLQCDEPKNS